MYECDVSIGFSSKGLGRKVRKQIHLNLRNFNDYQKKVKRNEENSFNIPSNTNFSINHLSTNLPPWDFVQMLSQSLKLIRNI